MRDLGHKETERLIRRMEREVAKVYQQAAEETKEKLDDYLRRFKIKDEKWRQMVANGERTVEQYKEWQKGQMMVGYRWEALQSQLAADYHNSNIIARNIVTGYRAEAYAINMNYGTFLVEKQSGVNTAFTLYNREAVERIIREQPELLPPPGKQMKKAIKENPDIAWQKGQIQSVTTQAIIQGESIPNMAKRIANTMGERNHEATIRYARTAVTGAQNAGRVDSFHRAEELGIEMEQQWQSVLDGRTRYEHRQLDGQTVPVGEPFKTVDGVEIMFPGDPACSDPGMIWNCRCGVWAKVKGWNSRDRRSLADLDGKSYEEWKNERKSQSRPITYQEDVGNAMKWRTIQEDYKR